MHNFKEIDTIYNDLKRTCENIFTKIDNNFTTKLVLLKLELERESPNGIEDFYPKDTLTDACKKKIFGKIIKNSSSGFKIANQIEGSFPDFETTQDNQTEFIIRLKALTTNLSYILFIKVSGNISDLLWPKHPLQNSFNNSFARALETALNLTIIHPDRAYFTPTSLVSILTEVGKDHLTTFCRVAYKKHAHDLFDTYNELSATPYEGADGYGIILLWNPQNDELSNSIKLKDPIPLDSDLKMMRKLLEISNDKLWLVTDGTHFHSYIRSDAPELTKKDAYTVHFTGSFKWELHKNDKRLMQVAHRIPTFVFSNINDLKPEEKFREIFSELKQEEINNLKNIIKLATKQKHGTMLVISEKPSDEATRLAKQSFPVEPFALDKNNVENISAIDGAILLGTDGMCHAFGVILDGRASPDLGSPARGARYNSSLRYLKLAKEELGIATAIVVISEDGMVDIFSNQPNHAS